MPIEKFIIHGVVVLGMTFSLLPLAASAQEMAPLQETCSDGALTIVIPPPPNVVKRTVWVPIVESRNLSRYEVRNAALQYIRRGRVSQSTKFHSSTYGVRRDPFSRRTTFHSGLDIKAPMDAPVGASLAGVVEFAGWYYGYGYLIIVHHGGGVRTHYAHLSRFSADIGSEVKRGTVIGCSGATGRATMPHLHYEVRIDGLALDPLQPLALDPDSDFFTRR